MSRAEMRSRAEIYSRSALVVLAFAAAGCVSRSYAGINLRPGKAPPAMQELARRASGGDKLARFALGERYECGEGVKQDPDQAAALYRAAAAARGGTHMMFVPQQGGAVSAVPVNTGAAVPGLPAARAKLAGIALAGSHAPANDAFLKKVTLNLDRVCRSSKPK